MLGDLNGWIGDRVRDGITSVFGLPENDNLRKMVEFCAERGLHGVNTYFKHKHLQ